MQPDCRDIKPVYEQITDGIRKMIITHAIPGRRTDGGIGKADCGIDPQRAAAGVRHGGNQTAEYVGRDRGIDRTYVGTGRRKQRL